MPKPNFRETTSAKSSPIEAFSPNLATLRDRSKKVNVRPRRQGAAGCPPRKNREKYFSGNCVKFCHFRRKITCRIIWAQTLNFSVIISLHVSVIYYQRH